MLLGHKRTRSSFQVLWYWFSIYNNHSFQLQVNARVFRDWFWEQDDGDAKAWVAGDEAVIGFWFPQPPLLSGSSWVQFKVNCHHLLTRKVTSSSLRAWQLSGTWLGSSIWSERQKLNVPGRIWSWTSSETTGEVTENSDDQLMASPAWPQTLCPKTP